MLRDERVLMHVVAQNGLHEFFTVGGIDLEEICDSSHNALL